MTFPSNISEYQDDNQQVLYDSLATNDLGNPQWLPPSELGQFYDGGDIRGVYVSDTIAYVADWDDGLEIIDVSDPANPTELGQFDDGGHACGVYVSGTIAYVAEWYGLEIIDVSDPANPTELGQFYDGGFARGVYVSGTIAYVADRSDGLEIINTGYDSDGDNLTDLTEITNTFTDPNDSDSDNDGMPDGWEVLNSLNPLLDDSSSDPDSDKFTNLDEFTHSTDPNDPDTDGDGLSDYDEVNTYFTDPNDSDTDSDGINDFNEVNTYFTDPNDSDTDNDGVNDGVEIALGFDPNNPFSSLIITILITVVIISPLIIGGIIFNRKRKESFNNRLILKIEESIKQGKELKDKTEFENAFNIFNEQLTISEKLHDSLNKEKIAKKIEDVIDDTLLLKINENIKQGEKLINSRSFDNAIKVFTDQFTISEKLNDSVNEEKIRTKIKNLIDETIVLKIEENIKQGEQLVNAGTFDNAINKFDSTLPEINKISNTKLKDQFHSILKEHIDNSSMKIKVILNLLSVLIIFFCISPIFKIIILFDFIEEYNGYLPLIVLFSSIILSIMILRNVRLEKLLFFQILYSMIIFGLNLGILIYFTIIIRDFWISMQIGLPSFKLTSIVSIFCSIPIVLLSYFQIKSRKHLKFSIEDLKRKIKLVYLRLGTLVAYFPIIAGILLSMTAMPALAYISWQIFYLWPGIDFMASWIFYLNGYSTNFPIYSLLWIELVIFICGFGLFLHGLIHLVKAKKKKIDIVQTGLYRYIRHPQNLGIIIFSFPFCLYIPFLGDSGLKVGDIFSWMLFFLLIIIYSDIEEIQMLKRYPDVYSLYRSNTGFFIPRIIKTKKEKERSDLEIKNYLFRWLFLIGGYILLISILTLIFSKFPLLHLRYYT